MRHILITLLLIFGAAGARAQKDVFWGDGGMSFARLLPGASLTYNYNVTHSLGIGAGVQVYDFHATMTNFQPVPALFWDMRFNIPSKEKSQYFLFVDVGLNLYKRSNEYWKDGDYRYYVRDDDGSYMGFGVGYFRPQTTRGWGHYVTLKMINNQYHAIALNMVTGEKSEPSEGGATIVLSFGFKF